MFSFIDPAGRNYLGSDSVALRFRQDLQGFYDKFARQVNSAFTWIEAFQEMVGGGLPQFASVEWAAFPITATATDKQIDKDRLQWQDEYVEWRTEVKQNKLTRVTFTTEFPEYYQAFASEGLDPLVASIQDAIPGATPTTEELFGPDFVPGSASPIARSQTFRNHLAQNPWNNGTKGILCLMQQSNTLHALFNLLGACGVLRTQGTTLNTCALVGGACGPGRNSDPNVCAAAQQSVRDKQAFTLRDPAGVRIIRLDGLWQIKNNPIDINDSNQNQGVWTVSRNGRRGELTIVQGLTLDGAPVATGAQVSKKLFVAADLLTAPDAALPDWAQLGNESDSRGPV